MRRFGNRVGGVFIDPAGALTRLDKSSRIPVRDALRKIHTTVPAGLNQPVETRMVSLRRPVDRAEFLIAA